mgnify:CR=1 FL=1
MTLLWVKNVNLLVRLWYHECCRVFQDRLVNDDDRHWFADLLKEKIKTRFNLDSGQALGSQILFFGDFIDPTTDYREYDEITDTTKVRINSFIVKSSSTDP